jgi:hypothetical protein
MLIAGLCMAIFAIICGQIAQSGLVCTGIAGSNPELIKQAEISHTRLLWFQGFTWLIIVTTMVIFILGNNALYRIQRTGE